MSNAVERLEQIGTDSIETKVRLRASKSISPTIHVVSQNFGATVTAAVYDASTEGATASSGEEAVGKLVRKLWPLAIKDELADLSDFGLGAKIIQEKHIRNLSVDVVFESVDGLK